MTEIYDLSNRFGYHPPSTGEVAADHQKVRETLYEAASTLNLMLPNGREKSLAITKLEEAMFFANAAIARNQ